ncbi:MAG: indole-3-glycerol phosphate synthase TrpC [Litoreibacter sp.]
MPPTILEKIKAYKLEEVAARKSECSIEEMRDRAAQASTVRGFATELQNASRDGYGLIAEIKKASPSKGLIREDFDVPALARAYEAGGATCLSVLTDTPSFQGADSFLVAARAACTLPVLRKDFLYDPYQVIEARALGADCILIIMASVSDDQAAELEAEAQKYDMDVLIEVHNAEELERGIKLKSPLVGINNRNLNTFDVTLDTTRTLARHIPDDKTIVAESGLFKPEDLADMARYGARSFLIGESLMRQENVTAATQHILSQPPATGGL